MASQGFPLPLCLCVLNFLLLLFCTSNDKFKSGVSCSETLHSNVADFEANDHLHMVAKRPKSPPPPPPPPPAPPPLPPFDHYILALQWPPSICKSKKCDISSVFTIHGLWPGSTDCNPNDKFDYLKLTKVTRDRLDKAWPGLVRTAGGQQQFLGHEWTKHGTCSGLSQSDYFEGALDLHTSVNVLYRLKEIGFGPDAKKKYNPSEIITAYENKWKLKIKIKCVPKIRSTDEMIGEIHFRVNKDAKTVESIAGSTTTGCTKTSVSFPDK